MWQEKQLIETCKSTDSEDPEKAAGDGPELLGPKAGSLRGLLF